MQERHTHLLPLKGKMPTGRVVAACIREEAPMNPQAIRNGSDATELRNEDAARDPLPALSQPGELLQRTTFTTSRLLDFFTRKELVAQTGHPPEVWPAVVLKELMDNALDACEDKAIAPEITVRVDKNGISVADNGPGIAKETIAKILDFSVRVSSREAYVSPTRGAQGNALKTIVAMPFVLHGECGQVMIESCGVCHTIKVRVDQIRQEPIVEHDARPSRLVKNGTFFFKTESSAFYKSRTTTPSSTRT
jgi:DNA topoisomerase VI subunit B